MPIFGVHVSRGEESEFYAVVAKDKDDAEMGFRIRTPDDVRIEVMPLETLLIEQYDGITILGTG